MYSQSKSYQDPYLEGAIPKHLSRLTEHEAMWQLSHWSSMVVHSGIRQLERLARGIAERYNEVINGIRYNINSASGESANADIKRI